MARYITINGETKYLAEWARACGIDSRTLASRLRHMPPERAIMVPIREQIGRLTRDNLMSHVTVDSTTGCWMWKKAKNSDGYGGKRCDGKYKRAHRMVYEMLVGVVPAGFFLCHKCDRPACVNPGHMFVGTNRDNVHDCIKKSRHWAPRGESHANAKLTESNVREIRKLNGVGMTASALASQFGVTASSIYAIIRRTSWAWLE